VDSDEPFRTMPCVLRPGERNALMPAFRLATTRRKPSPYGPRQLIRLSARICIHHPGTPAMLQAGMILVRTGSMGNRAQVAVLHEQGSETRTSAARSLFFVSGGHRRQERCKARICRPTPVRLPAVSTATTCRQKDQLYTLDGNWIAVTQAYLTSQDCKSRDVVRRPIGSIRPKWSPTCSTGGLARTASQRSPWIWMRKSTTNALRASQPAVRPEEIDTLARHKTEAWRNWPCPRSG